MMMKPHETKIPNTMAKVFGFGPLLFPVSENCENVQSDGQDTITFVFTSFIPLFSLCSPLAFPCSYKTHVLPQTKPLRFYPSHGVEPTTHHSPACLLLNIKQSFGPVQFHFRLALSIPINVQILYPHCSASQSIEKGDSYMRVGRKVWCARGLEMVGRMGLTFLLLRTVLSAWSLTPIALA